MPKDAGAAKADGDPNLQICRPMEQPRCGKTLAGMVGKRVQIHDETWAGTGPR